MYLFNGVQLPSSGAYFWQYCIKSTNKFIRVTEQNYVYSAGCVGASAHGLANHCDKESECILCYMF